jgi:hypothetical protein
MLFGCRLRLQSALANVARGDGGAKSALADIAIGGDGAESALLQDAAGE